MTLDCILWLTAHGDSSAHKWKKKIGLSYPEKLKAFPTPKPPCSWLSLQGAGLVSPTQDCLPFPSAIIPWPVHKINDLLLSSSRAQAKVVRESRDRGRFRCPPRNKTLSAKPELLHTERSAHPEFQHWWLNAHTWTVCDIRKRLSNCLCLRKALYNCIPHNKSVKINSLSWYLMAQLVCRLHFPHNAKH